MVADKGTPGTGPSTVLDDLLLYRLTRLLASAGSLVVRQCEGRHGITRREWRLIAILAQRGPLLSSELAAHAHLQRSRTSAAVTSLVSKGLGVRTPMPGNRRQVQVALTASGRAIHDDMMPFVATLNAELYAALPPADAARLDEMLERLQAQADRMAMTVEVPKDERRKGRRRTGDG
ncbi:MarR family winged helix-turn-helix transcriptional regulator [Piscinibacter sakaiensis]|uniref:Transcriptional regulator, MarR family n=1 Tax=Piscinibacter sakaiensis TaxID=1547922 RepID=A0A0K8NUK5_PISS1|nr:MarR family winged helix-turn-helix transcriptional regulator [Piscinibacter sakaiensis]GAP34081.1 transcriptional regulator, MarR family [Piscinibacter sakaiensis]